MDVLIKDFSGLVGQTVTVKGWAYNVVNKKTLAFLWLRDGSGFTQAVGAAIGPLVALAYLYYHPGDYKPLFFIAFAPPKAQFVEGGTNNEQPEPHNSVYDHE